MYIVEYGMNGGGDHYFREGSLLSGDRYFRDLLAATKN